MVDVARIGHDASRVGSHPETRLDPAALVEGHRHAAVADEDLLAGVLAVAVEVDPVRVVVAVVGEGDAPQVCGSEQSQANHLGTWRSVPSFSSVRSTQRSMPAPEDCWDCGQ
ncbi:hypothetical protein CKO22_14700 [Thiococcus pfennigii]|nr:hypothetical protein [Thiococcus pfennigii]